MIEAMKQALEALEELHRTGDTQVFDMCYAPKIIPALRQAIEQAEKQEPVAGQDTQEKCRIETVPAKGTLLPKREWVGLTLEEIDLLEELYAPPVHPDFVNDASHCLELIRHIEAKLKEKNT
jgi:hypothetical protein